MKNKLLSILAVTAVIVSLTACQSGETGQDIQSSEAVSSTTLASDSTQISETTAPQSAEEQQIETEYEITIDGTSAGRMKTNLGGKLSVSVELGDHAASVKVEKC